MDQTPFVAFARCAKSTETLNSCKCAFKSLEKVTLSSLVNRSSCVYARVYIWMYVAWQLLAPMIGVTSALMLIDNLHAQISCLTLVVHQLPLLLHDCLPKIGKPG